MDGAASEVETFIGRLVPGSVPEDPTTSGRPTNFLIFRLCTSLLVDQNIDFLRSNSSAMSSGPVSRVRSLFRVPGATLYSLSRDPLGLLSRLSAAEEPLARLLSPGENIYLINEAELVKEVLVTNSAKFRKGRGLERLRMILGNGLLTNEGEAHQRQRQIIQPVFSS